MSTTARLRPLFFCSLTLALFMSAAIGCRPADGPEQPPPGSDDAPAPAAVSARPGPEPAVPPAVAEPPLSRPLVSRPPAETQPPESQSVTRPQQAVVAPRVASEQPGVAAAEQTASNDLPPDRPKLGVNPLRDGLPDTPGERLGTTPPPLPDTSGASDDEQQKEEQEDEEYDPIKENGEIFEGWSKPKLALVITGCQDGYLEPCGCAGLERMKGGLSRRVSMFDEFRNKRGWTVAAVDVGGLVEGRGPQADLKFQTTMLAMQEMQYDVIAPGKSDLRFGLGTLMYGGMGEESPFVSANAALAELEPAFNWAPKRIVQAGGMKLGITSVFGKRWQKEINNTDVKLADPEKSLAKLVPVLKAECDTLILLAHATMDETLELARRFPDFDIVVTADGLPEPPDTPDFVDGSKITLIEVGHQATYAIVLGFFDDPAEPIRYQRVPLDSRFPHADYVRQLMTQYQEGLKRKGLEDLGVRPMPLPRQELLGEFVGTEKCKSCHEESYRVWKKSGHAKAWPTLVELDPPRVHDPECIGCHTVGWSPQNYRPYQSGFLGQEETPDLVNVGCEVCHGPGQTHVDAEMGADFDLQEKIRKAIVITVEESQEAVSKAATDRQPCMNCHDLDNSPDFDFQTYWLKIEHREE